MRLRADSASGYRFTAVATLAAAAAGITLLAGLIELRLSDLVLRPLIAVRDVPAPSWEATWLSAARMAPDIQATAVQEWLTVIGILLLSILTIAGVSALVALFAHASARRYEVALSAVVGASRRQLTWTQLRQAGQNAGIALLVGGVIGVAGALLANRTWPNSAAPAAPAGWLVVSVLFCGGLAAFVANRTAARMAHVGWMGDVLAPEARTNPGFGAEDLRNVLLHLQFALTFALLATALLVWQHARTSIARNASAYASQVHVTRLEIAPHATASQRRALLQELEEQATFATPGALLGVGSTDMVVSKCGQCEISFMWTPLFSLRTQQHVVGDGFFRAIEHAPHTGRDFESRDTNEHHVVVNDTFAGMAFRGQHPIGKQIKVGGLRGPWYTVIGVIHDVPVTGVTTYSANDKAFVKSRVAGKEPAIYFYAGERPPAVVDVVSKAPIELASAGISMRSRTTLAQMYAEARKPSRWLAGMLGALAVTAAIIATLSLGAITLLNVRQRELEIAARRAVGARRRDILRMIIGGSAAVIMRGTFVGIVLSIAVARAVQAMLPGMQILDVTTLGITALALAIVSLVAAVIPARAAAAVAPAQIHA